MLVQLSFICFPAESFLITNQMLNAFKNIWKKISTKLKDKEGTDKRSAEMKEFFFLKKIIHKIKKGVKQNLGDIFEDKNS